MNENFMRINLPESNTFLDLDKDLFKNLSGNELKILIGIFMSSNKKGEALLTESVLERSTGISKSTINRSINKLLKVKVDGSYILTRKIVGAGSRIISKYKFKLKPKESTSENKVSPKDLISYFCDEFTKEFGGTYKVSWSKDTTQMKNLMNVYPEEKLKEIIHVAITNYKNRWSSAKYPAPTIGALASWLCTQAEQIINKRANSINNKDKWDNYENKFDF